MHWRTRLWWLAVACVAVACGSPEAPRANRTAEGSTLEVSSLTASQRASVLARPDEARLLVGGRQTGSGMRAQHAEESGDGVRLTFGYPLREHGDYALHHPALDAPLQLAGEPRVPTPPRVVGVRPEAAVLPSNVLRLYVVFDEPMSSRFHVS
ncbi:MAG: hypothetical protein AAF602_09750, partial [Myxococcota bacterium]